jgi:hypothetical protein
MFAVYKYVVFISTIYVPFCMCPGQRDATVKYGTADHTDVGFHLLQCKKENETTFLGLS